MEVKKINIEGPLILQPKVFGDSRGYFLECYNQNDFKNFGIDYDFVQDNQSLSKKGILRGLHFQLPPYSQGKLVRVIQGRVLDVIVDLRKESPTYGEKYKIELSEDNFTMFWVPPGFAHGFVTLEDDTIFHYKCTSFYHPSHEDGIAWDDKTLNINWEIENPELSEKDQNNQSFADFNSPF